ncbi:MULTISPECIES: DUF5412 family protein [unclassified Paenibacillus]|uniref:DUF5412 family protein n=1 Tax=unclassified Paenibacillus TaxID=185978 RepID=UPI002405E5A2|nr:MULTISPECIES: DUF5412 family protein [unclassified Paenibacillus]MDF9843840.1 succinate dehydrogenase hydrophobic anchor subunit [Paenibacillus sp. PastF-2]MDF9850476.1 succinate dehydrogenase hydrophobic anchor subunit [Paenibacillus sp. PastM-2]MDF9857019.1 succinate dehydrogenase hydrophobic anchor subunit [Paenibacillus sp. PastF-1]MDH6482291.1 succinate dehydrogenase hydrophobic anchor subunit [Paenibacillus sp. PastH-2]MDH6509742.1 succinate dehydrogenase hydrophobic anchor subunit [P
MKKYNWCSFLLLLVLGGIIGGSVYSQIYNQWMISPPNYITLIFTVIALILGIVGFQDQSSWRAKVRSWFSMIFSSILIIVLTASLVFTALFSGSKELLKTVQSPDKKYTIHFYATDAGGMGSFGVLGELEGPLWFKKKVYIESKVNEVQTEWENAHTILINNHRLNLMDGESLIVK